MQTTLDSFITYLNTGGGWTWAAFLAGAWGIFNAVKAPFNTHARPAGILAVELGMVAMVLGGIGWWQVRAETSSGVVMMRDKQSALADTEDTEFVDGMVDDVVSQRAALVVIPLQVGFGSGGIAFILGLFMIIWDDRRAYKERPY